MAPCRKHRGAADATKELLQRLANCNRRHASDTAPDSVGEHQLHKKLDCVVLVFRDQQIDIRKDRSSDEIREQRQMIDIHAIQ
jgi:hypothetical protein